MLYRRLIKKVIRGRSLIFQRVLYDKRFFNVKYCIINIQPNSKLIITQWKSKAKDSADIGDYFSAFISSWISFNAYCYAKYYKEASVPSLEFKEVPSSLENLSNKLPDEKIELRIKKEVTKNKITLLLDEKSFLFIRERYIERKIFDMFSRGYQHRHKELIKKDFEYYQKVLNLQKVLKKGESGSSYVINMLKIDLIPSVELEKRQLVELNSRGVIVLLNDIMQFRQINDVLYQIRCNTFHGEKTPYGLNDTDVKVVKAAYDVLVNIMESYKDEWEIHI